eukprot:scaffold259772_cov50-Prasinocladus_malaysianus.AAC.1
MQLRSQLMSTCSIDLDPGILLENPSMNQLAAAIELAFANSFKELSTFGNVKLDDGRRVLTLDDICNDIIQITSKLCGAGMFNANLPILSLGIDSIGAVELRNEVSSTFDIELDASTILDNPTISQLSQRVLDIIDHHEENTNPLGLDKNPVINANTDEITVETVAAIVEQFLGTSIDIETPLLNLGVDSITSIELRNLLSDCFDIDLPANTILDNPTVSSLCNLIKQGDPRHHGGNTDTVARQIATNGDNLGNKLQRAAHLPHIVRTRVRIFCFHGLGASQPLDSLSREFASTHLPRWMEICDVVELGKGMLHESPPSTTFQDHAAFLADLLPTKDIPYVLLGFSIGNVAVMELLRQLTILGKSKPIAIFMLAPPNLFRQSFVSGLVESYHEILRASPRIDAKDGRSHLGDQMEDFGPDHLYEALLDVTKDPSTVLKNLDLMKNTLSAAGLPESNLKQHMTFFNLSIRRYEQICKTPDLYPMMQKGVAIDSRMLYNYALHVQKLDMGTLMGDVALKAIFKDVPLHVVVGDIDEVALAAHIDCDLSDHELLKSTLLEDYISAWKNWCANDIALNTMVLEDVGHFLNPSSFAKLERYVSNSLDKILAQLGL